MCLKINEPHKNNVTEKKKGVTVSVLQATLHSLKADILSSLPQILQVCHVFSLLWAKNTSKEYDTFPGKGKFVG